MGRVVLVLGGARSGKSGYAEELGDALAGPHFYLATAQAFDDEITQRIARHRADRAGHWQTVECPLPLLDAILEHDAEGSVILVDCLTLWLSNLMLGDHDIAAARSSLANMLPAVQGTLLLVSNEVGQGIVPDNALARQFRDEAGWLNQALARAADEVWFVTAGLPQRLK
ncbi:bifunctional adenosylcobinamide kinase/adenosylcobinamide-phosphate guanylyltransferase [Novosphingobium lentum]|uniref:bifunctional adenosylcobinamide kinase/adenosylcobinamide-phosphate guanylyltransferase n=1 Tax=Novosphingobium lentum TaxID=145287 RepID=UPI00082BD5CA|nr:bifunctional adenosylcobinamide kinase/adenosylcobinamide-phosphate guanylyltransferase [Novosphingobium lentum]